MRVELAEGFWEKFPQIEGTKLIIVKYGGQWFTTISSANGKQVHATSNCEDLQLCIDELSKSDMSLKREKELVSDQRVIDAMRRVRESMR